VLPIRFPLVFYKRLLNRQVTIADLAEVYPEGAASLRSMLEMAAKGEDVAACDCFWIGSVENFGEFVEVALVPDGSQKPVTNENVAAFCDTYVNWYLVSSIEKQFDLFRSGFSRVIPDSTIAQFGPDELDNLVSGEDVFEWDQLERNAGYKLGYDKSSQAVRWFWELFKDFSVLEKKKFLRFTTGTDRAPVGGLAHVVITIARLDPAGGGLPRGHTCFSQFALPDYRSRDQLRQKVILAINETEGFGLK
jgi:hypothetical protein